MDFFAAYELWFTSRTIELGTALTKILPSAIGVIIDSYLSWTKKEFAQILFQPSPEWVTSWDIVSQYGELYIWHNTIGDLRTYLITVDELSDLSALAAKYRPYYRANANPLAKVFTAIISARIESFERAKNRG